LKGSRQAYLPERQDFAPCTVYNRYALRPGTKIEGPALIEERESTCLIGSGQYAHVDDFYNLVVTLPFAEGENDGR
jgi:N-methylhydantoinase A